MLNKPVFISVVVPSCDRPTTLKDSIDSLLESDYPENFFEIIIVDQSSDDERKRQAEKEFRAINNLIYIHSNTKCSSDSRNKGWKKAKGEIVAFTDDDATVDIHWLSALAAAFQKYKNSIGIAGGRIIPVYQGKKPAWMPPEREYLLPSFDYGGEMRLFPPDSQPMSVNLAIWRFLLEDLGGFDTRLGLKNEAEIPYITGEDTWLGLKVRQAGYSIIYQPEAVVYHPVTPLRLKKRFFLLRNYREGATFIAIENVKEKCTEKALSNHIRWHHKKTCFLFLSFIKDYIVPKKTRARAYMHTASGIAFSLGVIRYAQYLKKRISKTHRK